MCLSSAFFCVKPLPFCFVRSEQVAMFCSVTMLARMLPRDDMSLSSDSDGEPRDALSAGGNA